jgi:hypothetical protein
VTWTAVTPGPGEPPILGYVIMINDEAEGDDYTTAYDGANNPAVLTATLGGLSARKNYRIKGYAVNKAGTSLESAVVS